MDYTKTHLKPLYQNGYEIIPIAKGCKFPKGVSDWQEIKATPKIAKTWRANKSLTGVGILTARTPAIDIDVQDEDIVEQIVQYMIEQNLIQEPLVARIGKAPKVLFPFRLEDGDKGFYKVQSSMYTDAFDDTHKVEVLGIGQQFVSHHIHPDTNEPYTYPFDNLADVPHADLPTLNAFQAKGLIEWFEDLAAQQDDWEIKNKVQQNVRVVHEPDDVSVLDNIVPTTGKTFKDIQRTLDHIDPDCSYDDWANVGMGLHHEFDGSDDGYALFKTWSKTGSKYDPATCNKAKWKSFKPDPTKGRPITFGTALSIAKDSEYEVEEADELSNKMGDYLDPKVGSKEAKQIDKYLKRYVYIEHGSLIADQADKNNYKFLPLEEFHKSHVNKRVNIGKPLVSKPDNTVSKPVSVLWQMHEGRKTVSDKMYAPGEPYIFKDGVKKYINSFYFPDYSKNEFYNSDVDQIDVFFEHMEYLLPSKKERKWLMQWVAFTIQQPDQRCPIMPILVAPVEGTGRTWMTSVLGRMIGKHNVQDVDVKQLLGDNSMYNSYLSGTKMVFCQELYMKAVSDRRKVNETLKSELSDPEKLIRHKYGGQGTESIYCNFLSNSNHVDAIPISADSRRYNVFQGPLEKRDREYYVKLHAWFKPKDKKKITDRMAQLFYYFEHMDISDFNIAIPMDTPARNKMIQLSQSDIDFVYESLKEKYSVLTVQDLFIELQNSNELLSVSVTIAHANAMLREHGSPIGRPKIEGDRPRLCSLDKTKAYTLSEATKLYKEYLASKDFEPSSKLKHKQEQ